MYIEDFCSSTSSLHNNHQKSFSDLGPFVDRFRDIPEPIRGDMIEASFSVLRKCLERIVEQIMGLTESCSAYTEQLTDVVFAVDRVGMEGVDKYREFRKKNVSKRSTTNAKASESWKKQRSDNEEPRENGEDAEEVAEEEEKEEGEEPDENESCTFVFDLVPDLGRNRHLELRLRPAGDDVKSRSPDGGGPAGSDERGDPCEREIAQNRMMEEEIRRELEFERQMAMRRFGE
ncbi:uncharacterized protein A4U43_C01F16000 [Asparagus officinalis]|uniref:Uncharacterized protein n=1 Tax=Asparagus officinalis TaxID=4686 RepID=A0A5P1FU99_ASPOF|nr:uncharacterized protein A4U43_C01F16000 [Asparagus officinalis]